MLVVSLGSRWGLTAVSLGSRWGLTGVSLGSGEESSKWLLTDYLHRFDHSLDADWTRTGHWLDSGGLLAVYWWLTGGSLEAYWKLTGGSLEAHWKLAGGSLGAHWRFTGHWLDTSRPPERAPEKNPQNDVFLHPACKAKVSSRQDGSTVFTVSLGPRSNFGVNFGDKINECSVSVV